MAKHPKQYEVLQRASLFLQQHNCETKIAEILLQHFLQLSRTEFYLNMQAIITEQTMQKFWDAINVHVTTGMPVQHLTGYEYFYGRKFYVNEHVLIPRPETEELIEHVVREMQMHKNDEHLTITDLGTGSGVIAITLALELPYTNVYATDISKKALHMAQKNAAKHHAKVQ